MSTAHIWTPGMAGPLGEFVSRLNRMVAAFAQEHGLERAEVRIELTDGSQHLVASATAEPGFGFFSFVPHRTVGEEPRNVVVPIGAVKLIEISTPDAEHPLGFAPSDEDPKTESGESQTPELRWDQASA